MTYKLYFSVALDGAQPKFQTFLRYAKVELAPPSPGELSQVSGGIQRLLSGLRTGRWKQLTVKVSEPHHLAGENLVPFI